MHSIILTVHNKGWLVEDVMKGIYENTHGDYELIVVLDGCSDNSEGIVLSNMKEENTTIIYEDDVFETKANNAGLRIAKGEYVIIVQDDMIIREDGWNKRMEKPFREFDDVFAVTSRTAHNWVINPASQHVHMKEHLDNCWSDIVIHTDHAQNGKIPRDIFAVRATVNRGPLMIDHADLKKLNYFDEEFSPQDMDDHDLMYRMHKELGKVCGCYWIDFETRDEWGGTREETGSPAAWLLRANQKNAKIFYSRHKDLLAMQYENEDRYLP